MGISTADTATLTLILGSVAASLKQVCSGFENDPVYSHELKPSGSGRTGRAGGVATPGSTRWPGPQRGDLWAIRPGLPAPGRYRVKARSVDKFPVGSGRQSLRLPHAHRHHRSDRPHRGAYPAAGEAAAFRLNDLRRPRSTWPSRRRSCVRPSGGSLPNPSRIRRAIRDVLKGIQDLLTVASSSWPAGPARPSFRTVHRRLKSPANLGLLPSLSLLKRTLNGVADPAAPPTSPTLPVCSDDTVASTDDAAMPTPPPRRRSPPTGGVATGLRRKSGPLVVFSAYRSSPQIGPRSNAAGCQL